MTPTVLQNLEEGPSNDIRNQTQSKSRFKHPRRANHNVPPERFMLSHFTLRRRAVPIPPESIQVCMKDMNSPTSNIGIRIGY